MRLALTNAGHRRALFLVEDLARQGHPAERLPEEDRRLLGLLESFSEPWAESLVQRELVSRRWAERLPDSVTDREVELRRRRNPIEHVGKAIVEFTTRCNFTCAHCYNAGVPRRTETDLDSLAAATDCLAELGIREFAFVGGEVSRYGTGWLELASRMSERGASRVGLVTNGWFLGERNFEAAGRRYRDVPAYLEDLRGHGLTHIAFSVDGPAAVHDRSRGREGLHARIIGGIALVREAGMKPRVSLIMRDESSLTPLALELGKALYGERPATILFDQTNIISNFIDIAGSEGTCVEEGYGLDELCRSGLRCAGFYRPAPRLTLKANGELATCRLADAGEGYGNYHERPLVDILNSMQESFVHRLHAGRRIGDYVGLLDRKIFGERFNHPCVARALVTMLARRMHDQGVAPGDEEGVARINREVAIAAGRRDA